MYRVIESKSAHGVNGESYWIRVREVSLVGERDMVAERTSAPLLIEKL